MTPSPSGLDYSRWSGLWSRLGAHGDGSPTFQQLAGAYAESSRAYHNAEHIERCLTELDWSRSLAVRPDEVEAALWFHDVVYEARRSDNERRSARLAETSLQSAGVNSEVARRVAALILATTHRSLVIEPDAQLVCDIDLAILAAPPAELDRFERAIRQEYRWVPEVLYRRSRSAVLRGFLLRPSIYQTADFRARYENRARQNLDGLVAVLAR